MSPLYESEVRTTMFGDAGNYDVKVYFSDELKETHPYELAYSSVHGGYLPYLFAGYFYEAGKYQKWFFGNARRHEEMRQAVSEHLGRDMDYVWGQLTFSPSLVKQGKLKIESLILHGNLPKSAIPQLRRQVRMDHFSPDFRTMNAR